MSNNRDKELQGAVRTYLLVNAIVVCAVGLVLSTIMLMGLGEAMYWLNHTAPPYIKLWAGTLWAFVWILFGWRMSRYD